MPFPSGQAFSQATDAIETYFDKQRALKRQAMIDELDRRNTESTIRDRDEATKFQAMQRQMAAELNEERKNQLKLKSLGGVDAPLSGETLRWLRSYRPDLIKEKPVYPDALAAGADIPEQGIKGGEQLLPFGGGTGPDGRNVPAALVPAPPASLQPSPESVFAGDQEDQEKKRKQDLIARIQQDPKWFASLPPIVQEMLFREATGGMPNANAFPPEMVPGQAVKADGTVVDLPGVKVRAGTPPVRLPNPPAGPRPQRNDYDYIEKINSDTGKPDLYRVDRHDPNGTPVLVGGGGFQRPHAGAGSAQDKPFTLNPNVTNPLRQAVVAYNNALAAGDKKKLKGAQDALFVAQSGVISQVTEPIFRDFAFSMLTPQGQMVAKSKSLDELLQGASTKFLKESGGKAPDPQQIQVLRLILSAILSKGQ